MNLEKIKSSTLGKKLVIYIYLFILNLKRYLLYNGKNGLLLKSLKGKYKERRCFIVGNGPSLIKDDLDKLKNEITFGFNRIYYYFDKTDWRPNFYITEDIKIIQNSIEEINKLKLNYIFAPDFVSLDYRLKIKNSISFRQEYKELGNNGPNFSEDILKKISWGGTVAYTAIQMAVYMGFKEIYLLGIDHNFRITQNSKGEITVDENAKDYFTEEYNKDQENLYIPNLDNSTKAYIKAKEYCEKNEIKIVNLTRGGKLEVFPRENIDELI
ncbi:MAG: 6-hydroxymethylpterin diphosphokinase MptE-like protein [Fusobacteriaceae bacterium]